jgi:acetyl esterase/lipase
VLDTQIENVKVRIYSPKNPLAQKLPIMIYYHGGGYVFGDMGNYK